MSGVPSTELSITITSVLNEVFWDSRDSRHFTIVAALLKQGTITETLTSPCCSVIALKIKSEAKRGF